MALHQIRLFALLVIPAQLIFAKPPPNIVLLIADDLGIGDVGCFGNDTIKTPNIDQIARDGARLTHHLTAASVCTPSRAAFLTGRYPKRIGMVANHILRVNIYVASTTGLPPNETTIGELVKERDYATGFIGKWHLGLHCTNSKDYCHHPLNQGFDHFFGLPLTNLKDFGDDGDSVVTAKAPYGRQMLLTVVVGGLVFFFVLKRIEIIGSKLFYILGFCLLLMAFSVHLLFGHLKLLNSIMMRNFEVVEQPIRLDNDLTQRLVGEGIGFLEDRKEDKRPFLLIMSWVQVHTALHTSKSFEGHSQHGRYGDNVEEMDWGVGEIQSALQNLGMADNTFVYFTSDNGGHLEEKGIDGSQEGGWNGIYRGGKTMGAMEGAIRVPTAAMWPGRIKPGTVINAPTTLMDIFPTVADIIDIPLPSDRIIDGKSLVPLLTGKSKAPPHEFLFHYCGAELHGARYSDNNGKDVWKAHFAAPTLIPGTDTCDFVCDCYGEKAKKYDPPLLYNIAQDPSERTAVDVKDKKNKEIVNRIKHAVEEHKNSLESVPDMYAIRHMLPRPWLQPCCNFPYCNCQDGAAKIKHP